MPRSIKFLHPRREWTPDDGADTNEGREFWRVNGTGHTRRFIEAQGRFVRGIHGPVAKGRIGFWGEYEADTDYRRIVPPGRRSNEAAGLPTYIHEPVLFPLPRPGAMNTDPLVLGPMWIYSNCLQDEGSELRRLGRGDVIFFGSRIDGVFVLDTVFVIAAGPLAYRRGQSRRMLPNQLPELVHELVLDHVKPGMMFSLYMGATFDEPVNSMYSFVPCISLAERPRGFARPAAPSSLQDGMRRNYKYNGLGNPEVLWAESAQAVLDAKLCLGVSMDLPN